MKLVAREIYRVLKKDRYCAILMGDTRHKKHQKPISFNILIYSLNKDLCSRKFNQTTT
jgi:hypothetical protein